MCCLEKTTEDCCLRKQQSWQNPWCEPSIRYTYLVMATIKFFFVLNHEIMKFIWISHETLFGGYVCPLTEFQNLLFRVLRREPLSVLYYCICAFLCHCCSFNPSLCHFSSFLLSYVAVSRPSCLSKFCSNRASVMWSWISIDSGKLPPTPLLTQLTQHFALSERLVLALGQGRGGWPSQHL